MPLSAFWVFDNNALDTGWNVDFKSGRSSMLEMVGQANKRLAKGAK